MAEEVHIIVTVIKNNFMDEEFKKFLTYFIVILVFYSFWENLKKDVLVERKNYNRNVSGVLDFNKGVPVNVLKR